MTSTEKRAAFSLAGIFSLRMLGLFMILPVFALYAEKLDGVTPVLVGLAIGIYGFTQAALQIPFGRLSDRVGRKPVIIGGLLLFALGSVVAATADTITGIIIGRALQGSGAIAAAVMALAADLTRESHRTKAMAVIGASIGFAFAVALVAGPVLNEWIGVPGIFWMTAVLALGGVAMVLFLVPNPAVTSVHRDAEVVPGEFGRVFRNAELLRLDWGIFTLHLVLTALFLAFPLQLRDLGGVAAADHWKVYLPVIVLALGLMVPFIIIAETRHKMKQVFLAAIAAVGIALVGMGWFASGLWELAAWLLLFFTAFNLLEATLPSMISKIAPPDNKGTAMGVYSTSQFIGAFLGGVAGGWVQQNYGIESLFLFCAAAIALWLLLAYRMKRPAQLSTYLLKLRGGVDPTAATEEKIRRIDGVVEVVVVEEDRIAYLKIDKKQLDERALEAWEASA